MVLCRKCNNKTSVSSLKLDFDEKMMICPECIKNKNAHNQIQEEISPKEEIKEDVEEEKILKVGHKCNSCDYEFKIGIDTDLPKKCPYCNARILSF